MFTAGVITGLAFVVPVGIVCFILGIVATAGVQLIVHVNMGD
jgi:hypothetical protein